MQTIRHGLVLLWAACVVAVAAACTSTPEPATEVKQGPAYASLKDPAVVKVVPIVLPERIDGSKDPGDEEKWRLEWPQRGANIVSDAIIDSSKGRVTARPVKDHPTEGWIVEVRVTSLDVGDAGKRQTSAFSSDSREGWSRTVADCRIINAATGEVAATLTLEHRTGSVLAWSVPFENDMDIIGERIGAWLAQR